MKKKFVLFMIFIALVLIILICFFISPSQNFLLRTLLTILMMIFIFLVLFIIFIRLLPELKKSNNLYDLKPTQIIDYLYKEYEKAKKDKEPEKEVRLTVQIKNLYNHLSEKDKLKYAEKIKEMDYFIP